MKKFNVIDLFCGAGGLSYGFKLAGFNIVGGVEIAETLLTDNAVEGNFVERTDDLHDGRGQRQKGCAMEEGLLFFRHR